MRSLLPLIAALVSTASAFSFPQLVFPRQDAPKNTSSSAPSNVTLGEAILPSSTFIQSFAGSVLGFALTADNRTGNVYFRMSGPSIYSWIGFGTGDEMGGSLMFIMYRDASGKRLVMSPRIAKGGEMEPFYDPSINLTIRDAPANDTVNGISSTTFYMTALCKECMSLGKTKIDTKRRDMPFIWALGPRGTDAYSDKFDAPLRRHAHYGRFTLDLTNAAGVGIPSLSPFKNQAQIKERDHIDLNYYESGHAFLMILVFLIVIPVAVFMIRVLERVKLHMIFQTIALFLVFLGFINGVLISRIYHRSKKYNTAHQVIGLIIFSLIIIQWTLGFLSHRTFTRTGQPLKWAMTPHKMFLGPIVFALGIVNASLGFRLALANALNYLYLPAMLVVILLLALASFYKRWFVTRWGPNRNPAHQGASPYGQTTGVVPGNTGYTAPPGEGGPYQHTGVYASRSDIALANLGDPPAYSSSSQPTKPREFA